MADRATASATDLSKFTKHIIGHDLELATPYGRPRLLYADWTASGRLYAPIERQLTENIGPWLGNTHSEASATGQAMTLAYHRAHAVLKAHVRASDDDLILTVGSGMTGAVNKLQRLLGLKAPEGLRRYITMPAEQRPVVFVTHMEHHSNHTSWYETLADVEVIEPDATGQVSVAALELLLAQYRERPVKIGSFTACSNVTGVHSPYHQLAAAMHRAGGVAFVDFAASAPYVTINMHPDDPEQRLDAVLFSPHKFLGGPGSAGVLVFHKSLYQNTVPDESGGGTVAWTNPWGGYAFLPDIEAREDAGTPGFLQTIRAAMAVQLKERMGVAAMQQREQVLTERMFAGLTGIARLHLLAPALRERLPIFSFYIDGLHYNLVVRLLSDRFGVQARGGCSCAGTYGHYLLHVDPERSQRITTGIDHGDLSEKPGWVRVSLHPTTTDAEVEVCLAAIAAVAEHGQAWAADYRYDGHINEYQHVSGYFGPDVAAWFDPEAW
jgi:selenocysteine lyase/cysteine desulfurase